MLVIGEPERIEEGLGIWQFYVLSVQCFWTPYE